MNTQYSKLGDEIKKLVGAFRRELDLGIHNVVETEVGNNPSGSKSADVKQCQKSSVPSSSANRKSGVIGNTRRYSHEDASLNIPKEHQAATPTICVSNNYVHVVCSEDNISKLIQLLDKKIADKPNKEMKHNEKKLSSEKDGEDSEDEEDSGDDYDDTEDDEDESKPPPILLKKKEKYLKVKPEKKY